MAEIVRRIKPGQSWRIKEHESWFSDMSEQGLHFFEIGTYFATFKKVIANKWITGWNWQKVKSLFGISRLRKDLKAGNLNDQSKPWEDFYRSSIIFSFIILVSSLIVAFIPFYQIMSMETTPLPEEDTGLPFVRLASIENQPHLKRKPFYFEGEDLGSTYSCRWSVFASVQYDSTERGVIQVSLKMQ